MTLEQIKEAVNKGSKVCWMAPVYEVKKDQKEQWLITCKLNNHSIGLTWADDKTLNGKEEDFFILEN
jgi:hypothetical protein